MTATGIATWALPFVLGLAVVEGSLSGTHLGVALAARTIGFLVVLPVAGVLADRHPARTTVSWACGAAAIATALLSVVDASAWTLAVTLFVIGAGQGACRPALQSLVQSCIAEQYRQEANAAFSIVLRASMLAGPALAGLAAAAFGAQWVLAGLAALWLVTAGIAPRGAMTATAAQDGREPGMIRPFIQDFGLGLSEARRHPWFVAGLGALVCVITSGYSVTAIALPLVTGSATSMAAAGTAYTLGALIGGVLAARWRPGAQGWVALAGLGLYALAPIALVLDLPLAGLVVTYIVVGVGIEVFNVPWFTCTQREVPPDKLARVSSLDFLVSYGLAPVGLAVMAPAIEAFGVTPVLTAAAAICVLGPLAAAFVPTSRTFGVRRPGSDRGRPARAVRG